MKVIKLAVSFVFCFWDLWFHWGKLYYYATLTKGLFSLSPHTLFGPQLMWYMVETLNLILFFNKSGENCDKEVENIFGYTPLAHIMAMPAPVLGSILTTNSFFVVCVHLVFSHQIHFFIYSLNYVNI